MSELAQEASTAIGSARSAITANAIWIGRFKADSSRLAARLSRLLGRLKSGMMPTIAVFQGIVIYMYWAEHGVAHLHAMFGEEEAVFSIDTGKVIVGKLGRKRRRLVSDWIALRRTELLENWRRGRSGLPFERVPGPEDE